MDPIKNFNRLAGLVPMRHTFAESKAKDDTEEAPKKSYADLAKEADDQSTEADRVHDYADNVKPKHADHESNIGYHKMVSAHHAAEAHSAAGAHPSAPKGHSHWTKGAKYARLARAAAKARYGREEALELGEKLGLYSGPATGRYPVDNSDPNNFSRPAPTIIPSIGTRPGKPPKRKLKLKKDKKDTAA